MADLDDKLKEILTDQFGYSETQGDNADEVIAEIKKAFADAGYHNTTLSPEGDATFVVRKCMTGAEWYSRFEKELQSIMDSPENRWTLNQIRGAAQRASG